MVNMTPLRGIRARFHIHDSVLFRFQNQTRVINQVVLKSRAKELIPEEQEHYLQQSFEGLIDEHLDQTRNDSDMKGLFRRAYKQFLKDGDLREYFSNSAIVHQIRVNLNGNLKMRKDGLNFVRELKRDNLEFGVLKSGYLRSLGYMDNHYTKLLSGIGKRSNAPMDDVKCSQILPSNDSFANEGILQSYLQQFNHSERTNDYLVVNTPQAAEALTSMGFKLGLKLILVTEPFFPTPTSTLEPLLSQYEEASKTQNNPLCQQIRQELISLDQITVKNLEEVQRFIGIVKDKQILNYDTNFSSFWSTLEQMELSILGNLESRHGPSAQKSY